MKSLRIIVSILVLSAFSTSFAQQPVAPPPRPANDAPANAEVLSLLRSGMPESVVLNRIHAITDKFDSSTSALVALKQAGATEAELNAVMAQGSATADAPLAAASSTSGPTLAETMQFIQEKLNGLGKVAFVFFSQNASNGSTWTETRANEIGNVVADQNQCRISYHRLAAAKGQTYKDENSVFSLRDVQEIVVMPEVQDQNEYEAKHGDPNIIVTSTSPSMTALLLHRSHGEENFFLFTDANLADRVAKALMHAVELCGGGNKDKF
jgi:hypothetical protein